MIVTFVSECEKKAFTRTRRILNKYAYQIGRRTWQGRLSEEGLNDIYQELRESATRQTSVACHRVHGKSKTALVWIVGNQQYFNREGWFSFSQTRRDLLKHVEELPNNYRLLGYLLSLAALFHDIGKANAFFQAKLKDGKKIRDPYRHEFVSVLILSQVILKISPEKDKDWLETFSKRETLKECFNEVLDKEQWFDVTTPDRQVPVWKHLRKFSKLPLFSSLLWLILTHHKLPEGDYGKNKFKFCVNEAFFGSQEILDKEQAIHFSSKHKMPWHDNQWCQKVSLTVENLNYLLQESPPQLLFQLDSLKMSLAHIARPFLVLGDYQASYAKTFFQLNSKDTEVFANTIDGKLADTLNTHLHKVEKQTSRCFRLLMNASKNPEFQTIQEVEIPLILTQKRKLANCHPDFAWQEDCCQKIRLEHKNAIQSSGFFGILAAKTGAGKTVAAAKIMTMLSNELRFSLALGLRSLTLQAGQDYQDKSRIGFDTHQLAVMVGSKTSQALFEEQQNLQIEENNSQSGTYNQGISEIEEAILWGEEEALKESFPVLTTKERKILATPLLISTVDHLISPTDGRRSKSTLMSLRLMTSDLILDEVDSYSYEDLVSLGKLVYLSGLYGRKVLLVSATLPPAIAINFYRAYLTGFKQFLLLNNENEKKIFCGWFSDQYQYSQLRQCGDEIKYQNLHSIFSQNITSHLKQQRAKQLAQLLNVTDCKQPEELFEQVLHSCFSLHQRHFVKDENTGARVSIGLVRWNNTRPCVAFSRYLLDRDSLISDFPFKLICYHAKLLPIVLHEIEVFCQKALKRQQDKLTSQPEIQTILATEHPKDLVIIIAATSIIEVGRDFDFDWAVFEPQSTRSIIQSAGRVLRHRDKIPESANIALMNTSYRGLFSPKQPAYSYPGIETPNLRYHCKLSSSIVDEIFDFTMMTHGVNAHYALIEPTLEQTEISYHEHQAYKAYLEQDEEGRDLNCWLNLSDAHLQTYHSKTNLFRQDLQQKSLYLFKHLEIEENTVYLASQWQTLNNRKQIQDYPNSRLQEIKINYPQRLLLDINVEKSLQKLNKSPQFNQLLLEKLVAIELNFTEGTPELIYHHALGLSKK